MQLAAAHQAPRDVGRLQRGAKRMSSPAEFFIYLSRPNF